MFRKIERSRAAHSLFMMPLNENLSKTDSITLWLMDITGASMIPDLPNFPKVKPGIPSKIAKKYRKDILLC